MTVFLWTPKNLQDNIADSKNILEIRVNGKVKESRDLSKDFDGIIDTSTTGGGINKYKIKDGKVYMTEADCNDKICVNTKPVFKPGESIVCLPHKVVLIIKNNDNELDSVSK